MQYTRVRRKAKAAFGGVRYGRISAREGADDDFLAKPTGRHRARPPQVAASVQDQPLGETSSGASAGSIVANAAASPDYPGVQNLVNLFQLSIEKVIVALMMTLIIINGEIDLSAASVMGLAACLMA